MNMTIDLWEEDGEQRMALIDAEAGTVLHQWRLDKIPPTQHRQLTPCLACRYRPTVQFIIKRLFHSAFKANAAMEYAQMTATMSCKGRCNRR